MDVAILGAKQKNTLREETIASGPACFLIIGFKCPWHVVMDDVTQIRFIDPHSKSIRSDDRLELAGHELILNMLALLGEQTGVVSSHGKFQILGEFLY